MSKHIVWTLKRLQPRYGSWGMLGLMIPQEVLPVCVRKGLPSFMAGVANYHSIQSPVVRSVGLSPAKLLAGKIIGRFANKPRSLRQDCFSAWIAEASDFLAKFFGGLQKVKSSKNSVALRFKHDQPSIDHHEPTYLCTCVCWLEEPCDPCQSQRTVHLV